MADTERSGQRQGTAEDSWRPGVPSSSSSPLLPIPCTSSTAQTIPCMPPKRPLASTSSATLPPPNLSHPCASHLPLAAASAHTHSASYHSFLTSSYFPSKPKAGARGKAAIQGLPRLVKDALDAEVVQSALLAWFDRVKKKRGMPWRKEVDLSRASKAARTQRGYEVSPEWKCSSRDVQRD